MATTTLISTTRGPNGKPKEVIATVNVTHNNARLLNYTDGETYEFIRLDASANRVYRNARKIRG